MGKYISVYLIALFFLSVNPWLVPNSGHVAKSGFITWDLVYHLVAYGVLTAMLMSLYSTRRKTFLIAIAVILTATGVGLAIEFAQKLLTTNRHFSWQDAGANAIGAVLGSAVYIAVRSLRSFRLNRAARAAAKLSQSAMSGTPR